MTFPNKIYLIQNRKKISWDDVLYDKDKDYAEYIKVDPIKKILDLVDDLTAVMELESYNEISYQSSLAIKLYNEIKGLQNES